MSTLQDAMIYPIQPFFVLHTTKYYKKKLFGSKIAHFYRFRYEATEQASSYVVPSGAIDIVFECDPEAPRGWIYGLVLQREKRSFRPGIAYFGVRFMPAMVSNFYELSIQDMVDTVFPLEDIMKSKSVIEEIALADNFERQIQLFLDAFHTDMNMQDSIHMPLFVFDLLQYIYKKQGAVQIQQLELASNYSRRHINRVFKEYTGLSVKTFCKYIQFQKSLQMLNQGHYHQLTDVALDCGYYDQSHFLKDFKKCASIAPSLYVQEIQPDSYQKRIIEIL